MMRTSAGNEELCRIAALGSVPIPLDHICGRDPDKTMVCVGYTIEYSPEDIEELELDDSDPRP